MKISLFHALCYSVGWIICVWFGSRGETLMAVSGAFLLLVLQWIAVKKKGIFPFIHDLLFSLFIIPCGFILELFFLLTGAIVYKGDASILPPLWIVMLYPLFALSYIHSLDFIKTGKIRLFLFGLFGAPLSYLAGKSLGAVAFPHSIALTLLFLGGFWGLFLLLIAKMDTAIQNAIITTSNEANDKSKLTMLYDGECPLCSREVCILKNRNTQNSVQFTDITKNEFAPFKSLIPYEVAMSQIHAVDETGKKLTGLVVFAKIYARCGLYLLSTLLNLKIVTFFLDPLYTLFAKYRLKITGRR